MIPYFLIFSHIFWQIMFILQAAAAWALGQAGRHTPEHAKAVAQANVLPTLLQCYLRAGSSEDLQTKVLELSQPFLFSHIKSGY